MDQWINGVPRLHVESATYSFSYIVAGSPSMLCITNCKESFKYMKINMLHKHGTLAP